MTLRLATAQLAITGEVPTADVLATAGQRIRDVMADAAQQGARLVHLPEGSLSYPHKRLMSRSAPDVDESDWTRADWAALRSELAAIGDAARDLGIWVVVSAPHWIADGRRPHTSLYVFSDDGRLVTRYDKQRLSMTEITHMYAPGIEPVTFTVDGIKVGMVLCLEALFPDLFIAYADDGVDLVLVSSSGAGVFGQLALAYSAITWMSISLSIPPEDDGRFTAGVCGPFGWVASAPDGGPALVLSDIPPRQAIPFHFEARHGLYDGRLDPNEPRTLDRTSL
jgi:predicted amidohydrolase